MDKFVRVSDVIDRFRTYGHVDQNIPFETLVTDLRDSIPAADVVPVVHARWIIGGVGCCNLIGNWHCSECSGTSLRYSNFCPNCGAKMDGGAYCGTG